MIRRNHIEAVTRIDRQVLRYEPKDSYRESAHKKYLKAESENMGEQTFRVTSSNKKYHQYKDWKQQHKTKPNEVQRKQSLRVAQQLSQFQTNQNECLNSLNRNYDRQAQEKIFDFSTLKTYNQPEITAKQNTFDNIRRKRLSQHHYRQSQPKSTEIQQNLQVQKLQNNQYLKTKYDCERYSPSKRNQNYASIQKYPQNKYPSSNKYYPPLFDSNLHNTSINKWQRPEIPNSAKAPGKIAYYQNSVKSRKQDTFRTFAVGGFEAEKTKKYALQEKREVKKLPLSKIQNQGEEVSEKLKKISQFNDQINQRIKNIITCFETLKGKI